MYLQCLSAAVSPAENWVREENKEAKKLEGRDGVKMTSEVFDTSIAAGSASHAILRGYTDIHYFTCPVVTRLETKTHTRTVSVLTMQCPI